VPSKLADAYVTRELLESMATDYLRGADPADPRCSSVFADLHDLPPLLIRVGEDEILFDDAARIRDAARAAGVDTTF
jgi:monoterpene epsilon-lactone hydrolase